MKSYLKSPLCLIIGATLLLFSCSKKSDNNNTPAADPIVATWTTSAFGGVSSNPLSFKVNSGATTGTVSSVGSSPFGFAVGDQIFTDLKASGAGYTGMGKYTYGASSENSGTRAVNITLQNNGSQLTADYPAINASFPEIVYVYQKAN
jgi:hypothetical protein